MYCCIGGVDVSVGVDIGDIGGGGGVYEYDGDDDDGGDGRWDGGGLNAFWGGWEVYAVFCENGDGDVVVDGGGVDVNVGCDLGLDEVLAAKGISSSS